MRVTTIATEGLGDRSYIVDDGTTAVVIDPQRDVDRVLAHLAQHRLTLAAVCETHIHNDYVTGGLGLARMTGAEYLVHAEDQVTFARRGVSDGDEVTVGDLSLRALHSPGHTHTHLSYLLADRHEGSALFTGGSMLYGTVGRTDLLGPDHTDRLTRSQYHSVRRMAAEVPEDTAVYPTHGFGSFCASAGGGNRTEGTIADELQENIACTTDDEDDFVQSLLGGLTAHPPYYQHMGPLNLAGPQVPDLSLPRPASPDDLGTRIARGEWVIDVRDRRAFAESHVAGTVSVDVTGDLATYVGWTIPWGTPVSLVADDDSQIATAQRELVRIGLDRPLGMATGGPQQFGAGLSTGSYRVASFAEIPADDGVTIVDVRRQDEWDEGHLDGAIHLPMERLASEAGDLPEGRELWVHCQSGYRSSIGASLIARAGKPVVYIDDEWDNAGQAGRPVV